MKKILAIGNSFSSDATKYVELLAYQKGISINLTNLYIPACSLSMHCEHFCRPDVLYEVQRQGETIAHDNLQNILESQWDIITIQQVSGLSGSVDDLEPSLGRLLKILKNTQPKAQILWHQTWPYEAGSLHEDFGRYHHKPDRMLSAIQEVSDYVLEHYHIESIPVGSELMKRIQKEHGIYRDGYHLSDPPGRYWAAKIWRETLIEKGNI